MTYEDWKKRYPISDWLLSGKHVKPDDCIVWWDDVFGETSAHVLWSSNDEKGEYIVASYVSYEAIWGDPVKEVDKLYLFDKVIFVTQSKKDPSCTCGAKHTSNPKYHLPYCDLSRG